MSEYQERKAIALENQRKKEAQFKRELEEKQQKEKERARDEAEKARQRDIAAKEARRLELQRANAALNSAKEVKSGNEEWNPFAEDERPVVVLPTSTVKPGGKPTNGTSSSNRAGPSKPRESKAGSSTPRAKREVSPLNLTRKEKAKRSFALSAKKSEKSASIFSIRDMVEARQGPGPGTLASRRDVDPRRPNPTNGAGAIYGSSMNKHNPKSYAHAGLNGGNGLGGLKNQIKAGFNKAEPMRKLCPDRETRDKRTTDQIQTDLRAARKAREEAAAPAAPVPSAPVRAKPKPPPLPTTARPAPSTTASAPTGKTRRDRSPSPASSYDSEDSDRPRKRRRDDNSRERQRELQERASVSAQIQAMFRRPGAAAARGYNDVYSDDDSDMEAGIDEVEEEDRRAAAIARREDRLAEEEEKARRLAKEKARKEKAGR